MIGLLIGIAVEGEGKCGNEIGRGERGALAKKRNVTGMQTANVVGITDVYHFLLIGLVRGEMMRDVPEVLNGTLAMNMTINLGVGEDGRLWATIVKRGHVLAEETMITITVDAIPEDIHVLLTTQGHGHPTITIHVEGESGALRPVILPKMRTRMKKGPSELNEVVLQNLQKPT